MIEPRPLRPLFAGFLLAGLAGAVRAQVTLPDMIVRAERGIPAASAVPFATTGLEGDAIRHSPAFTLDGTLRGIPGFSLFRRSDSFSANPSSQGVSLRGLGPSGASRSLVLLDGIPLNDPFGGWVSWSKVPRESLASADVVRGGGATAWGNAALGGVIDLRTAVMPAPPPAASARLAAAAGSFGTHVVEGSAIVPVQDGAIQFSGRDFGTDGFRLVAREDRGAIDLPAGSEHRWGHVRWTQRFASGITATATARLYREERGNGTPYQRNSSEEEFASVALRGSGRDGFAWQALAYGQDQNFTSTFSSVNAARSAETPASDQFAVPATAAGASWTGVWEHGGQAFTTLGGDYRRVRGETRENYSYSAGTFTRHRVAGGTQDIGGVFAQHERKLGEALHATLGARIDGWRDSDGHRRETERATGNALRNDRYAAEDGIEFSPSVGLVWTAAPGWRWRAAVQQSFRRPTLNELYRPFRVGNVITEANAALETERSTGGEAGVEYERGAWWLAATVFRNELRDAVGNVTIAKGPGTFPIVGFVPAGGTGRQRLNLDRLRVQGIELAARWQPATSFSLRVDYQYDDAAVRRASAAPALAGKRLAQVPRHVGAASLQWRPAPALTVTLRGRVMGRQFEDDENLLVLGTAVVADIGAAYAVSTRTELYLNAENLTDARIEIGRSVDGIVNTGTPRLITGGLRVAW